MAVKKKRVVKVKGVEWDVVKDPLKRHLGNLALARQNLTGQTDPGLTLLLEEVAHQLFEIAGALRGLWGMADDAFPTKPKNDDEEDKK